MTFIDKSELYSRIDLLRARHGIDGALDPYSFAEKLGVRISVYPFDSRRFSGALLCGARHAEIILSAARSPEGRRFTAAHELVHYLLHGRRDFYCDTGSSATALEWQANEGAAELLLPYRLFLRDAGNIRFVILSNRERAARILAEKYSVSPAMARTRLESLEYEFDQYLSGCKIEDIKLLSRSKVKTPPRVLLDVFP